MFPNCLLPLGRSIQGLSTKKAGGFEDCPPELRKCSHTVASGICHCMDISPFVRLWVIIFQHWVALVAGGHPEMPRISPYSPDCSTPGRQSCGWVPFVENVTGTVRQTRETEHPRTLHPGFWSVALACSPRKTIHSAVIWWNRSQARFTQILVAVSVIATQALPLTHTQKKFEIHLFLSKYFENISPRFPRNFLCLLCFYKITNN